MSIYEAETIAKAVKLGLTDLVLRKDEAHIEILEKGKKGFLGMGRKNAKISLKPNISKTVSGTIKETIEEVLDEECSVMLGKNIIEHSTESDIISEKLNELDDEAALTKLTVYLTEISKQLNAPALVKKTREANIIFFHLITDKQGLLIGKHGKTLNALQYLSQVFIHRVAKNKIFVIVNVGDYREKRQKIIQRLIDRTAEKVIRTGQPVFLDPMPAFERKQIHSILRRNEYVSTHSEGNEPYRYLVVEPVKK